MILIQINTVPVADLYCRFAYEAFSETDRNGKKETHYGIVATFTRNGEVKHRCYNVRLNGSQSLLDTLAALQDRKQAEKEALDIIQSANRSGHSPFAYLKTDADYADHKEEKKADTKEQPNTPGHPNA